MLEAQGTKRIDARQLVLLLFVCRAFTLMAYIPHGRQQVGGSVVMAASPLAFLFHLLLLLPAYYVLKAWGGKDILDCAYQQRKWLGNLSAFLAWLFCLFQCLYTMCNQDIFLTSTIYTRNSSRTIMLILGLAALYMAKLGLESFSRLSLGIFVAYLALLVMVTISIAPHIDTLYLRNPLQDGAAPLVSTALRIAGVNGELAAIVLLAPMVRGRMKKPCVVLALMWMAVVSMIAFITLTTLGDFARTQMFPVYTVSTVAEFFLFERMDSFHMAAWTFMGLIKTALYLYLAARSMGYLLGGRLAPWALAINGTLVVVVSVLLGGRFSLDFANFTATLYPMLIITVGIPAAIVLVSGFFKRGKRYGQ